MRLGPCEPMGPDRSAFVAADTHGQRCRTQPSGRGRMVDRRNGSIRAQVRRDAHDLEPSVVLRGHNTLPASAGAVAQPATQRILVVHDIPHERAVDDHRLGAGSEVGSLEAPAGKDLDLE